MLYRLAQLPDDLIRALGTVEIARLLTSQSASGLQSITLDQNRITFSDPVLAVVPGFAQLGGGGKIIGLRTTELTAEGILFQLAAPWTWTLQYSDMSHCFAGTTRKWLV